MGKIRTRYAPSPTGNPHVGNIHTALFNYLFSKSQKGEFLLRIEDTDRERFISESVKYIENSLKWLGIKYDSESIYQSSRLPKYQKYAQKLINEDKAYKCFCSKERLKKIRKDQKKKKLAPAYDRHCRDLDNRKIKELENKKIPYVIRLKIPDKESIDWIDLVYGTIGMQYRFIEDFIIVKSDSWPTYNFANVIDDHEMGITHVIRGKEFIPSTPKHLLLYKLFGWEAPKYAHMPHILGKDKSKLSKRHGDTAILDYKDKGYLPESMINFLALLGWNPGDNREKFTLKQLEKEFSIKRIQKSPAVFDIEKLNWLNGVYIREKKVSELLKIIRENKELNKGLEKTNDEFLEKVLTVEQTRISYLAQIKEFNFYFKEPKINVKSLIFKKSTQGATKKGLEAVLEALEGISDSKWDNISIENFNTLISNIVAKNKLSNGDVFWPVRYTLSGVEKSPSPTELLWVFGKKESIKRLNKALEKLK